MLIRQNARRPNEVRDLMITTDPVAGADGTCQVIMGGTRVSCAVECHQDLKGMHVVYNESGKMKWQRQHPSAEQPSSHEAGVVNWVKKALAPSMVSATNQDAGWLVILETSADDGSIEAACTIAATTAVAIAVQQRAHRTETSGGLGLHLRHQVIAITLGTFGGDIAVDLDKGEMQAAEMIAQLAVTSHGHIAEMILDTRFQECQLSQLMAMANIATEQAKSYFHSIDQAIGLACRDRAANTIPHRKAFRIG